MNTTKFNLSKTAWMFHAIPTEYYNSERSEKSFKLLFPYRKKRKKERKKWGFKKFKHSIY